jgi:hypothetical protein
MKPERLIELVFHGLLGRVPLKAYRIWYEVGGTLDERDGPLELEFAEGSLTFEAASDGERLVIRSEPWKDEFSEPMTDANRRYVAEHGKWVKKEVSNQAPYAGLIGNEIETVTPLKNRFGSIAGVELGSRGLQLCFFVDGDEAEVRLGLPAGYERARSAESGVS